MFCKKCGKTLNDSAEFCPFCGEKVISPTPAVNNPNPIFQNSSVYSSSDAKSLGFWRFIWCDFLYILIYYVICISVVGIVVSSSAGSLVGGILGLLSVIATIMMWKANRIKPALIMLLISLGLVIVFPLLVLF